MNALRTLCILTCLLAGAAWWLGAAPQGLWPPLALGSLLGTLFAAWRSRPRERHLRGAAATSDSYSDFGTSSFYAGSDNDSSSGDDSSCSSTDSGGDSSSDCSDSGGSDD